VTRRLENRDCAAARTRSAARTYQQTALLVCCGDHTDAFARRVRPSVVRTLLVSWCDAALHLTDIVLWCRCRMPDIWTKVGSCGPPYTSYTAHRTVLLIVLAGAASVALYSLW